MMMLCSTARGVELAQTQAEIEALPNGSELLSIYPENDIETYRDAWFEYGTDDYDTVEESMNAAWKIKQEIDREIQRRKQFTLEQEKRESEERQTETVVGRVAVPVAEYEYVNGELRQINGEESGQKPKEPVVERQAEQTVEAKPIKEEKSVPPVTQKPVKSSEKVVEKKPQQSVRKKAAVAAQKCQEQVRRNNAVQSSKMAEKAKMEAKKQAHVKAFQSDERALPDLSNIQWGDGTQDDYDFGR